MSANQPPKDGRPNSVPLRVRLPGFVADHEIGLGQVVTRAIGKFGVRPCPGCATRADTLNRWLVFSGRKKS